MPICNAGLTCQQPTSTQRPPASLPFPLLLVSSVRLRSSSSSSLCQRTATGPPPRQSSLPPSSPFCWVLLVDLSIVHFSPGGGLFSKSLDLLCSLSVSSQPLFFLLLSPPAPPLILRYFLWWLLKRLSCTSALTDKNSHKAQPPHHRFSCSPNLTAIVYSLADF